MANSSHKRDTDARLLSRLPRSVRMAAPVATLATVGVVAAGVVVASPHEAPSAALGTVAPLAGATISGALEREAPVSRSAPQTPQVVVEAGPKLKVDRARQRRIAEREARQATRAAIAAADTRLWATADLNLWTAAKGGKNVALLDEGSKVLVTGRKAGGRTEIARGGASRWVTSGHLTDEKPEPAASSASGSSEGSGSPSLGGACTNGSSVAGRPNVIAVHRAVCAAFPSITSYGTYRGDGEHAQGIAIDIMVSGGTGWQVAEFVRANHAALGVSYVIYSQRIWSVQRSGEGWRPMSDRGSTTANHYDHVHVTTY